MCCMICVDVLKEKLTYREVDNNCKELISIPSSLEVEHYRTVDEAIRDYYYHGMSSFDAIVPKEALRGLKIEE